MQKWTKKDEAVRRSLQAARTRLPTVVVSDKIRERTARLCMDLGTDGLRGELTLIRAARAIASLDGQESVSEQHLRRAAPIALRHRLRRDPLDEVGSTARIDRVMADMFGA